MGVLLRVCITVGDKAVSSFLCIILCCLLLDISSRVGFPLSEIGFARVFRT